MFENNTHARRLFDFAQIVADDRRAELESLVEPSLLELWRGGAKEAPPNSRADGATGRG